MPAERWHELQDVLLGHDRFDTDASPTLSDRILRCGVQFADGSKATNVEHPGWNGPEPSAPSPPVFTESGGGLDGGSTNEVHIDRGFWLWPLPPAEPFTLVVEWPAAGVSLTKTEVDGAAIVTASEAAVPFW
ncbi:MAG TPA: hypothetical protein VFJ19_16025 [Nocardioidaceae bacterium]|nr:hypothetical protein [Nocardioidaceae bacterium]